LRLNKFISESGYCSRREADRFILQGNVYINGYKAGVGQQVNAGDLVRVNGIELEPRADEDLVLIALNKPVGITSTTDEGTRDNIVKFVNHSRRIFPVGRLDKDSQGLILLTNNGDIVNKILRAGNNHEKEYVVTVDRPLTEEVILGMSNGVPMLGVTTRKCRIELLTATSFRIVLVQGLNRQIRRMCSHFGYDVIKLERTRIMNITLKGIPAGEWRDLTEQEINTLQSLLGKSSSLDPDEGRPSKAVRAIKPGKASDLNGKKEIIKSPHKNTGGRRPSKPGRKTDHSQRTVRNGPATKKSGRRKGRR